MASNPMQQFSVHKIGPEIKIAGIDLSFTNSSLFMVISASVILFFLFLHSIFKQENTKSPVFLCDIHIFCKKILPTYFRSKSTKIFLKIIHIINM